MMVKEFFAQFTLHDSVLLQIVQNPRDQKLALLVDLCNYDQPAFTPEQPQMVTR